MINLFLRTVTIMLIWAYQVTKEHCDLLIDDRSECGYPGISKVECEDRNCCWIPFSANDLRNPPWCSKHARNYCGYEMISTNLLQDKCNNSRTANLTVENIYEDVLRVKIVRSSGDFQIPGTEYDTEISANASKLKFESYTDKYDNFNFKIIRVDSGQVIWNTDLSDDVLSASSITMKFMYTQIGSRLPLNHSIFGLGYHSGKLKVEPGSRLTLFARDSPTVENQNLYGAHPFYLQLQDGMAHGVYLRNSYGMDVLVGDNLIKFKALGGPIDLFFFSGPTPLDVIEQYTRIIGRPAMFDYRILGFHQSRYGYRNISQIQRVIEGYNKSRIPLDTIWHDIDYMEDKKVFTFDKLNFPPKKLENFVNQLLKDHKRIIPILDPGIKIENNYGPYKRGTQKGIFIRNPTCFAPKNKFYVGEVWPGHVHFVDFMNKNASAYWESEIGRFLKLFNESKVIGGLWLDMNEPSNFIDGYNYTFPDLPSDYSRFSPNFPRYSINNGGNEAPIYQKTVPMDAETSLGQMYETHNLYGLYESMVTYKAMLELEPQQRPFLLTRSTFPGSGHWTATWLGDNLSTFPHMALSIPGVLQYGLEGLPLSGPDICGFLGNVTEELCARWMALGSFYPFARNHNSIDAKVDQEPFRWESVANVSRKYLNLRYSLLPFYYTLMHSASVSGYPLWRPICFYENSTEALDINDQFFIGRELLISPVLMESTDLVNVRLPTGEWYDWESFNFVKSTLNPIKVLYKTPIDFIPIHLRAGSILVIQEPRLTMYETRQTNFTILIAFDSADKASADFYWDDGFSFDVGDKYINLIIEAEVVDKVMKINLRGQINCDCPFIWRLVVLTAGQKHHPSSDSTFDVIEKDFGFEIIFGKPKDFKELDGFIVKFGN